MKGNLGCTCEPAKGPLVGVDNSTLAPEKTCVRSTKPQDARNTQIDTVEYHPTFSLEYGSGNSSDMSSVGQIRDLVPSTENQRHPIPAENDPVPLHQEGLYNYWQFQDYGSSRNTQELMEFLYPQCTMGGTHTPVSPIVYSGIGGGTPNASLPGRTNDFSHDDFSS